MHRIFSHTFAKVPGVADLQLLAIVAVKKAKFGEGFMKWQRSRPATVWRSGKGSRWQQHDHA